MTVWRKFGNVLFTLILLGALAAGTGSLALGRPVLATIIKSNSMDPMYQRGDVAFVWNWPGQVSEGDIVVFKPQSGALAGQWTMHRVVGTDVEGNYLTMGDAAQATDQQDSLAGPVARKDIVAKALTLGGVPVKVPWVGMLPLRLDTSRQGMQRNLLGIALVVMVVVGAVEMARQSKRRRRGEEIDPRLVFISIGVILSVLLMAMTLYQTVRITLVYEVGPDPGVIMGQPVGIITPGEVVRKELSSLSNKGFMPMILLVTERDPNVFADASLEVLPAGTERQVYIEVRGDVEGSHNSLIELSMVFPLLPMSVLASLALVNHWLAALAGCVLPGVVMVSVAIFEPVNRRRTARDIRALQRRFARMVSP